MGRRIKGGLQIDAHNYSLVKAGGRGILIECSDKNELHYRVDSFMIETVDPEASEPLPREESENHCDKSVERGFAI